MASKKKSPGTAYGSIVSQIIKERSRASKFKPKLALDLEVKNRREPKRLDELVREEKLQLGAIFGKDLATELANEENSLEAAEVIDRTTGKVRFRLYGWNFGVGYLFAAKGLDVVAYGNQHDVEPWNLAQRDVFYAMDRAIRRRGHGFTQPLSFGWWDEASWEEIAGEAPGTVRSEPYIRRDMTQAAAKGAKGRGQVKGKAKGKAKG